MIPFGQICLLAAFVATGYAAFACFVGWKGQRPLLKARARLVWPALWR